MTVQGKGCVSNGHEGKKMSVLMLRTKGGRVCFSAGGQEGGRVPVIHWGRGNVYIYYAHRAKYLLFSFHVCNYRLY